jgi:tetratricopeptide (TPR) repeat protein
VEIQVQEAATQWAVFLLSFGTGAFFFGYGMYIRLGYSKQYFLKEESGLLGADTYHFFPLVGGIFMILGLIALAPDLETRQKLMIYILVPCLIVAFLIGISRPSWLRPRFDRRLQQNHPDVYTILREVAREEIGDDRERARQWSKRMDSERGRNEWVTEVRQRKGMPQQQPYGPSRPSMKVPRRYRGQIKEVQALPNTSKGLEGQIEIYEQVLETLAPGEEPEFWAAVQNRLGIAYTERRRGKPGDNVEKAIAAYNAALEVLSPEKSPIDWAMAQNNLGAAYRKRTKGERAENVEKAIAAYDAALSVFRDEEFPLYWAGTQSSLGLAYSKRVQGDRGGNLEQAIVAFEGALKVYTELGYTAQRKATEKRLKAALSQRDSASY